MVLNHRIIAMVGTAPKRVECSTCNSHHNYRATAPGEKKTSGGATGTGTTGTTRAAGPKAPRMSAAATRALQAEADHRNTWEKAIAGKAMGDFVNYRISNTFEQGDLVRHSKFGDGVVTRVIDIRKVEVLFKDEARTLAQAMVD
jgi:hypothetical protein